MDNHHFTGSNAFAKRAQGAISSVVARPLVAVAIGVTLITSIFLLGVGVGFSAGSWSASVSARAEAPAASTSVVEENLTGAKAALAPHFSIFWEAMDLIYGDYYGDLPDSERVTYAAIQSVLDQIDDPNTSFLTPDEAEIFHSGLEGSFDGIGARVAWDDELDTLMIVEPFEDHPAWLAGLRRNDRILAVDGDNIRGTDLNTAVAKIRGPQGSSVVLTVQRAGSDFTFDVEVVRDRIEIPTISTESLDDIAYIRLNSFNENAGQLVQEAVRNAMQRKPAGMILDLRGNTGGLLREAVEVTSVFLQDQTVLIERFGDETVKTYETVGKAMIGDVSLVVLVNEGSASASEIVAGALQDASRATLIGTPTFGKGSVQMPHTLSNGAIIRVTVARWYTPAGRTIDGVGLTPDYLIEVEDAEPAMRTDLQLEGALQFLRTGAIEVESIYGQ